MDALLAVTIANCVVVFLILHVIKKIKRECVLVIKSGVGATLRDLYKTTYQRTAANECTIAALESLSAGYCSSNVQQHLNHGPQKVKVIV